MSERAVELWRGSHMESRVYADVAVVDSLGNMRFWAGDPHRETFWRSSAKPFQAMPVVLSGAASQLGFGPQQVAICCASHGGEPFHVELVDDLLHRIGASEEDLICGRHAPSYQPAAQELVESGSPIRIAHNNCSGKHSGMLATAQALGVSWAGYQEQDHPVQQHIRQVVAYMTGLSSHNISTAIDGCGVPTFYLPLSRMAYAYARMVDPRGLDPERAAAAMIIGEAMRVHPQLVSGTGRLEVTLAEATNHRFVAKAGAEAVFCLGVPERGVGVAIKIDDGNARVMAPTVVATLAEAGLLSDSEVANLSDQLEPILRNHAGTEVGRMRAVLRLHSGHLA